MQENDDDLGFVFGCKPHKVMIQPTKKKAGISYGGVAWCTCGWSTPTVNGIGNVRSRAKDHIKEANLERA